MFGLSGAASLVHTYKQGARRLLHSEGSRTFFSEPIRVSFGGTVTALVLAYVCRRPDRRSPCLFFCLGSCSSVAVCRSAVLSGAGLGPSRSS